MTVTSTKKYSTAVYAYSPPVLAGSIHGDQNASRDSQAILAARNELLESIRHNMEARLAKVSSFSKTPTGIQSSRWFLQIRSLRLAIPGEAQSSSARTMYMARNSAQPDSLTLVIEDPTHAAVNISHLAASSFDYYMSTNLLLPLGTKDAAGGSTAPGSVGQQIDPREQLQRNQSSRWIPRPSFAQIEGITLQDPTADFQISIGMISGRGGTAASSATVGSDLVIQLEYLPTSFLPSSIGYGILEDYLRALIPRRATIRDVSAETTSLDWKSLMGLPSDKEEMPPWSARNTSWCLVKICKEAKML